MTDHQTEINKTADTIVRQCQKCAAAELRHLALNCIMLADEADKTASNSSYGLRIAARQAQERANKLDPPEGTTNELL